MVDGEIDLTGLEKQIKDVDNTIKDLNKQLQVAEKRVGDIADKDTASRMQAFKKGILGMETSIRNLYNSVSEGEVKTKGFYKLLEQLSQAKNIGVLPVTGMLESLNKIESGLGGIMKQYDKILNSVHGTTESMREQARVEAQEASAAAKVADEMNRQTQAQKNIASAASKVTQEEIKRFSNEQKIADAKNAELKIQKRLEELVSQGNQKGIQQYLKQAMSVDRLEKVLQGLQNAQKQCNLATEECRKQYQKLGAEIQYVEGILGKTVSLSQKMNAIFGRTKDLASQVAMSFGVMTGVFGAVSFIKSLYRITSEFQLQQRALGAIIQNTREANILFKQMQSLSVESPMKLMDLNKYAKQLAAFRIETVNLYDSLKMLGDISVGVGVDMNRLILAYGQVKAANYLRGQELRQFSEAGVNILGGLQEYYRQTKNINMSINEIFDSVSKRKVLFEDVDAVLKRMTQSGGEFYNMQLIQSQTLYGQTQKLADLFQISMNNIGQSTSGMLMGAVKLVQMLIKNLRIVVSVIAGFSIGKGIGALVINIQKSVVGARALGVSLHAARVAANMLGKSNFTSLIMGLRSAGFAANALTFAIQAAAIALSYFFAKRAENKQKEEDIQRALIEEITEYNKRIKEIRDLEQAYEKDTTFSGRLAILGQLIEKAKEYRLALQVDENITPTNINKNFEEATEQLKKYSEQVLLYKSAIYTTDVNEALQGLNDVNIAFANATLSAQNMINALSGIYDKLTDEQKKALDEITKTDEAFAKNDKKALEDIAYTYEQWQVERLKKLSALSATATTAQGDKTRWFGFSQVDGLTEAQEKQFDRMVTNLRDFGVQYSREFKNVTEKIKPKIENIISADDFVGLDESQIKEKIKEVAPPILDAINEAGEFAKQNMPDILQFIWDLDKGNAVSVAKVLLEIEKSKTDATNTALQRLIDDIASSDENGFVRTLKYNLEIEQTDGNVFVGTAEEAEQLKIINEEKREEYENTMKIVDAVQSVVGGEKDKEKAFQEGVKQYREYVKLIERGKKNGIEEELILRRVNQLMGTQFHTLVDMMDYIKTELANAKIFGDKMLYEWPEEKTASGRAQDTAAKYRKEIDFIKKLGSEYQKLIKDFDKESINGFEGAYDKILKAYGGKDGEFSTFHKKFRDMFEDSMANINFTTKEGVIAGEKMMEGLIEGAKDVAGEKKQELLRYVRQIMGDLRTEIETESKKLFDERLKNEIQSMIDDYNLTVELKKIDINVDDVTKLFNITKRSLSEIQDILISRRGEFMGTDMEKQYRELWRKIQDINDKENLELSKKYLKHLRNMFDERSQIELEYMRQRAEIYALPFDSTQEAKILENLQREVNEKLQKLNWDEFRATDYYIEMFEDLDRVSTQSIEDMIRKLEELKSVSKDLQPTEIKTITEQIQKLRDEVIQRNPFKELISSLKEYQAFKTDDKNQNLVDAYLGRGTDEDAKISGFKNRLDRAIDIAQKKVADAKEKLNLQEQLYGAATSRDAGLKELNLPITISKESIKQAMDELENQKDELQASLSLFSKEDIVSNETLQREQEYANVLEERIRLYAEIYSAMQKLDEEGQANTNVDALRILWEKADEELKKYIGDVEKLKSGRKQLTDSEKAIIAIAEGWKDTADKVKGAFDTVMDNLDYLGGATDELTDAWKDFGDTLFDTITRALEMIPTLVTGFTAAGVAINSAMGIIGLIAEAIQLVITLLASISKLHDAQITKDIAKLQKDLDRLSDTAEDLKGVFDELFNEDQIRAYDAAIIRTRELMIAELQKMIAAERSKKKTDQSLIDDYNQQINEAVEANREQVEDFYNQLGGVGGLAAAHQVAEEWTDAWWEAFKETGDGLSGLEDSFDEFLENIFKKQILNKFADQYFSELFNELNTILAKEGGLQQNRDEFTDWVNKVRETFGYFNEDAQQLAQTLLNATGGIGGGLEGLTQSIQGMTEETADILAGYLSTIVSNSIDNNARIEALAQALTQDNGGSPIIEQLKVIAQQTTAINMLLDSVVSPTGDSGFGARIKVVL